MRCPGCGAAAPQEASFCPACGASLLAPTRSPARLSQVTIALLAVKIAALLALAGAAYYRAGVDGRLLDFRVVQESEVDRAQFFYHEANRVDLVVSIAVLVVFIWWSHRCYTNLAPDERRFSPRWAIWGWLVPVMCLWRPKQVFNDLAASRFGGGVSRRLLTAWWVVFLVYLGASRVIAQILQTHSLRTFREALLFNAANIVLVGVSWAILAIVVVREITRGQTSAGAHARSSSVDRDVAQPLT